MNILIISLAVDPHGLAVAAALEQHGHTVVVWCEPLVAGTYRGTVDFTEDEVHWSFGGARYSQSDFDIVWLRRHSRIEMPKWIHEDDLIYAQQENNAFFRWFWSGLSAQTVWIHSLCGYLTSETKAIQLNVAKQIGFTIPETILSNDGDEIRAFVAKHSNQGGTIYKTFYPMGWNEGDIVKPVYTVRVTDEDVEDDMLLAATPGIFQRRIAKGSEVRATFFGVNSFCVNIDSQRCVDGEDDWRQVLDVEKIMSPTKLPRPTEELCLSYMRKMGMDVACFDFIIDENDQYIFLECNQQGQFLWIEIAIPSIKLLGEFCSFLLDRSGCRHSEGRQIREVSFHDVYGSSEYEDVSESVAKQGFYMSPRRG